MWGVVFARHGVLNTGKVQFEGNDSNLLVVLVFQHGSVSGDNDISLSGHGTFQNPIVRFIG